MQTCTESGSLLSCCPGRDSGEKEKKNNFFFHLRIYKYLLTQFTVERGLCVYILIKEYASLWAEQKYFAG